MRILFLNDLHDPRIGSSVRQMYELGTRLRELGHETLLVTATQDAALATPTTVEGMAVERIHSDYSVRLRAWTSLDNPRVRGRVREILLRWKPDVVHSHLLHTHLSYASLTAARESGAGVVFTAHDVMTFCYQKLTCFHGGEEHGGTLRDYQAYWQKCIPCQRFRYNPWRNAGIRKVLARDVHRFTVVSDELGVVLRQNRIRVDRTVHNAIQRTKERPSEEDVRAFRARHHLEGAFVIAIGGRLHEQKGVVQLFKVLARLAGEFPALRLLVMGKKEIYEGEFRARAEALGIADRVVPAGWLDGRELQAAYAAIDVLVTPSICFDTFGMVNLEAMAHRKPVLATIFGGSPEVVLDGETGLIGNPFDVEEFAARLRELCRDPELCRRLGEAGYERLQARFLIDRLAREFLEEYELAIALARHGAVQVSPVPPDVVDR